MKIAPENLAETLDKLAAEYERSLLASLTPEEAVQVRDRNRAQESAHIDHAHDFLDANQVMLDAFEAVVGRAVHLCEDTPESEALQEHDFDIINSCWVRLV